MKGANPLRRILFPAHTPDAGPAALITARRVLAGVWLTVSVATFTVWLLIFIIGGNLLHPFWIWSTGAGAVLVAGLWLATEARGRAR